MTAKTSTRTRKTTTPATAPKATPAPVATPALCGCGCGETNVTAKASYRSGHDARHAGRVGKALIAGSPTAQADLAALPTAALRSKAEAMVTAHAARQAKVAARKAATTAAKAAAKAAYDAAMAKA